MSTTTHQQHLTYSPGRHSMPNGLLVTIVLWLFFCPCDFTDECGNWRELENNDGGRLVSPKFPEPYPSNLTCVVAISVNESLRLDLNILYFDSAPGDSLSVYQEFPGPDAIPRWSFGSHVLNDTHFSTYQSVWLQLISFGPIETSRRIFEIEFEFFVDVSSECPDVSAPSNGYMSSRNFSLNSVITFGCGPGFVLQGARSVTCINLESTNPTWSSDIPTCSPPCIFTKARLGLSDSFYGVPTDVNVILSPDYPGVIVGPIACAWQILAPDGIVKVVISDTVPIHSPFSLEIWKNAMADFLDSGSIKHLVANKTNFEEPLEYTISGEAVSVILRTSSQSSSGKFSISIERSSVTNCDPPPLTNFLVYYHHKSQYEIGDVITYSCEGTYVLTTSRNVSNVCLPHGLWSNSKLISLPVCGADCRRWSPEHQTFIPLIISSQHGTLYSEGYPNPITPGVCFYTFEAGSQGIYTFDMISGNLTNTQLTFTQTIGSNTLVTSWNSSQFVPRVSTVVLTTTSENPTDKFIISYEKQHVDFKCKVPHLSDNLLLNNRSTQSGYIIGSTIEFSCNPMFDVSGSNESICVFVNSTTADWWPDIPSCMGSCGGSLVSDNLTVVSPGYPDSYGRSDYTQCHWEIKNSEKKPFEIVAKEMYLSPDANLTISDSRQFVYLSDMCRTNCSWVSVITDGDLVSIDFHFDRDGQDLSYQTLFSIQLRSVSFSRCNSPTAISNGEILGNNYGEGSSIRYICHPPYDLEGPSISTCVRDSSGTLFWDGSQRRCVIIDCTPPSDVIDRIAGKGAIASPGFPNRILTGHQECIWVIRAVVLDKRIALSFTYLDFPSDHQRRPSSVLIYDTGENKKVLLLNVTGSSSATNVTSQTDSVRVEYYGPSVNRQGYRGMYLQYQAQPRPITTTDSLSPKASSTGTSSTTAVPTESTTTKLPDKQTTPTTPTTTRVTDETSKHSTLPSSTESYISPTTISSDKTTRFEEQQKRPQSSNPGGIVAGVIIPIALLAFGIGFYVWYRRKYPVRMIVGKNFPKFSNPIYEKGSSTLTLVKEDMPINDQKQ